jgi:hypothetical protein
MLAQPSKRAARGRDGDEVRSLERCCLAHARDRIGDVADVAERHGCIARRETSGLGDLRCALASLVRPHEQLKRAHVRLAALRGAALRPVVDQRRPAEVL